MTTASREVMAQREFFDWAETQGARREKLREYGTVPTIRRYVIVELDAAAVTVLSRDGAGEPFRTAGLDAGDVLAPRNSASRSRSQRSTRASPWTKRTSRARRAYKRSVMRRHTALHRGGRR